MGPMGTWAMCPWAHGHMAHGHMAHGPMSPWAHGPWAYEHMAHGPMGPWAHGPWAWVTIGQCAHGSLGALRQRPRIHVGWADLSVNVTTVNVVVARH